MKRCEDLALQEGDLVDVSAPDWQGGRAYDCKVLVVSSKGGVLVARGTWEAGGRWVQYRHVVALGRREELTEKERDSQRYEVERFQSDCERRQRKAKERYLRRRSPQALYHFVWDELGDSEGCALEALQAKAKARGLEADAVTWRRIGRVLGCGKDPQFWRTPLGKPNISVIVEPRRLPAASPDQYSGHVFLA
jgi:hypothetical protein